MGRWLTEAIGTFFLVLIIGFCVVEGLGDLTPVAVAIGLSALVYMAGPVSGAHFNPAVTLAFTVEGTHPRREMVPYLVAEFVGAFLATAVVWHLMRAEFVLAPDLQHGAVRPFVAEMLFTFALMLVILNVAVPEAVKGNHYYGVAIGFVVGAGAFAVGDVSGAAFNPAVGLAPSVLHALAGGGLVPGSWIYLVAPTLGALLAVPVFRLQYPRPQSP